MSIKHQKTLTQSWETFISLAQTIGGTKTGKNLAKQWSGKIALILASLGTTTTSAHALEITPTYSSEIDLQTTQIINDVVSVWEQELKDAVTLNINFSFSNELPTGILGGSKPAMVRVDYKDYLTVLGQDALSYDDKRIVKQQLQGTQSETTLNNSSSTQLYDPTSTSLENSSLIQFDNYTTGVIERRDFEVEETKTFDLLIDTQFNPGNLANIGESEDVPASLDNNGNDNNRKIWLTRANAKALNLVPTNDTQALDATIVLSDVVNWDMDASDGVDSNAYDFRTVILHEIGHALGYVSGADAIEYLMSNTSDPLTDQDLTYVTPMNTYTYSSMSQDLGVIDLRVGQGIPKYASFNQGINSLSDKNGEPAFLSTGSLGVGGDGYQSSHWKNNSQLLGVMKPALAMGESLSISELDLQFLDGMGWDLINRSRQLMEQVGLDYDAFQAELNNNHQTVVDTAATDWENYNPGETIRDELDAELWDLYKDIELKIEAELSDLQQRLAGISDPIQQDIERGNTLARIWDLIDAQDNILQSLSVEMRDVDNQVRLWLDQDVNHLADLLRDANRIEIRTLDKILEEATDTDRILWEDKLRQALALFLENPEQALAQINATNDFYSPMGGGSGSSGTGGGWWGGWWSSSVENSQDVDFYNYNTAAVASDVKTAQSVPEPSAIIGLVALGGMGWLTRKSKH
ncbi:NF038122 family metalloprotease [Crocosphaera sp.]|uniref:NF038122 family metalloprotease n=1 Tax=Crocosphaera sp. TaxID=2729996 RepID=UPI003F1F5874